MLRQKAQPRRDSCHMLHLDAERNPLRNAATFGLQMAACQVKRVAVTQAEERAAEAKAAMERAEATLQDANPAAELACLDGELQAVSIAIWRLREVMLSLSLCAGRDGLGWGVPLSVSSRHLHSAR